MESLEFGGKFLGTKHSPCGSFSPAILVSIVGFCVLCLLKA